MLSRGAQPVPVTVIVVPRGPDAGEMAIAGLTAAVVALCVGRLLGERDRVGEVDGDPDGDEADAVARGENDGVIGVGDDVGLMAVSADGPLPECVSAAMPTPRSTATTSTAITRIGEIAGLRSSSSSMASRTASTEGSTDVARSVIRSS